jgi:hypothetical protein
VIAADRYMKREDCGIVYQVNVAPGRQRGLIGAALADQNEAVTHQQSCHDEAEGRSRRSRVGDGLRVFHTSSVNGQ